MAVIKRDGRIVEFDVSKIVDAIIKTMNSLNIDITSNEYDLISNISKHIETIHDSGNMSVEDIQDIIEHKLMSSNYKNVAKSFILYRQKRTNARDCNSGLISSVLKKIEAKEVQNSNANVDEFSFSGREKEMADIIKKQLALEFNGLSKDVAKAHIEMLIYNHDLDKAVIGQHNCLFADIPKLFKDGFKTRNGSVRSPNSFSTACQLIAVIFQVQSQNQFGGIGTIALDRDLAPYVRKSFIKHYVTALKYFYEQELSVNDVDSSIPIDDPIWSDLPDANEYAMDMLNKEGRQATQALYHNLNTLESRQGSQVPFTSINLGRDTSTEGRLVSKWIFEASLAGIGKHNITSIFPISIFQYKQGTNANKEDKNYDLKQLALKSMSKRIYPEINWGLI